MENTKRLGGPGEPEHNQRLTATLTNTASRLVTVLLLTAAVCARFSQLPAGFGGSPSRINFTKARQGP